MDIRWMRDFMASRTELNFGRAAQRVHLAQPAVTAQILNLEKCLGVELFSADNRGVRLTDAGQAFRKPCRAALQARGGGCRAGPQQRVRRHGKRRVGFNVGFSIDPLVPLTMAVRSTYPHLDPQVDVLRLNTEISRRVQTEELDLGLVGGRVGGLLIGLELAWRLIGVARLCVMVPADHPWQRARGCR